MNDSDGDGYYEVTAPAGAYKNVIFCRMNPSATANNWSKKWNQTSDLTVEGDNNCYTVKEGTLDQGGGDWSVHTPVVETEPVVTAPAVEQSIAVHFQNIMDWSSVYAYTWNLDTNYYAAYAKLSDGSYVYSAAYDYSPKKYSMNMLGKSTTSEKQKALCVAMLNYGAAAQEYFGYNTESLMNAELTAEQQALVMAYDKSCSPALWQPTKGKLAALPRLPVASARSLQACPLRGRSA